MNGILAYIDIILLFLVLFFLFFSFRKTLGRKVGYQRKKEEGYTLIKDEPKIKEVVEEATENKYKYPVGSMLNKLEIIENTDILFTKDSFINSSKEAFKMILKAFAEGSLSDVKDFIAPNIYKAFDGAIQDRDKNNHKMEVEIKNFIATDIVEVKIDDKNNAFISVKYTTEQKRLIYPKEDIPNLNINSKEIVDTWVYAKNIEENSSIWKLVKTS